jgi:hypothetical protein
MNKDVSILKDLMVRLNMELSTLVIGSTLYKKRSAEIKALHDVIKKDTEKSLFTRIFTCKKKTI